VPTDLDRAIETVLRRCLAVTAGEELLVIADPGNAALGHAFIDAGRALDADPVLVVLPPRAARGTEPPRSVAAAFAACDVFVAPCLPSLSHTVARRTATEKGIRGATLPGVSEEMLARLMSVEFEAMAARCAAVAELLSGADEAHVTCPRGTDLRLDLRGRTGIADDGDLTHTGAFGNLPCGEGFISPLGGEGTAVVSSLALLGLVDEPVTVTVRDGAIADASGAAGAKLIEMLTAHGEAGRNLAELGVGTNDRATLSGNILEDEKLLGSVHVAFGASASIGGTVTVPVHLDVLVLDATLTVGSTTVLDAGRYAL
jgi:leucyl aminopeptidase (aminopeptidase T)